MPRSVKGRIIPVAPVDRLIRLKSNTNRVSEPAGEELAKILEALGGIIAKRADELTIISGRKTIKAKDIILAFKQLVPKYQTLNMDFSL